MNFTKNTKISLSHLWIKQFYLLLTKQERITVHFCIQIKNMKYISILFLAIGTLSFAQTDVLLEDFQSGIPLTFTLIDNDGLTPNASVAEYTEAWISKVDPDDNANMTASSTSYFDPIGVSSRWLVTPSLTLGAFGNYFSWQAKSHDASFPDSYLVMLSTTDTQVSSFTDTLYVGVQESEYWTTRQVNLSEAGYDNQSVYIAIANRTYNGYKLYVDSMHVWKEDPVSISEIASIDFNVFPNPTANSIKITTEHKIERISIINLNGETILTTALKTIDLSELSSGVYFVEVKTENGTARKRISKI